MNVTKTLLPGLAALAFGLGAALGVANAQDDAMPEPAPQVEMPAAAAPDVSDEKLKSFAVAFLEVSRITQTYQPQLQAAASPEDEQRIRQQAGTEMIQAVDSSEGISVDEYNIIIQAAQVDPELAQRINGHITEAAADQSGQPVPAPEPAQPAVE